MANSLSGWNTAVANIKSAGLATAMIRTTSDAGVLDTAFYDIGSIDQPQVKLTAISKADGNLRPMPFAQLVEFVLPSFQASATEIAILDNLATAKVAEVRLGLPDTTYIDTHLLTAHPYMGVMWKLICAGDMDDFRKIEYTLRSAYKLTELDTLVVATGGVTAVGTPNVSDVLYTLAQAPVRANQKPNGLSKIEINSEAADTYEDFGDFSKGTYTFECIGEDGGGGRKMPRTTAIKFTFDAEGHESALTQLELVDTINSSDIYLKLTHMDGVIATITPTNIGVTAEIDASGDVSKIRKVKLHAEGSFTPTQFAAIWS